MRLESVSVCRAIVSPRTLNTLARSFTTSSGKVSLIVGVSLPVTALICETYAEGRR